MLQKNFKVLRYRYVANLKDIQLIFDIANKHSWICELNHEYRYEVDGVAHRTSLKESSFVFDSNRYYKLTTMYVVDKEDKKTGKIKYLDITEEGINKYVCTWIFDKTGENAVNIHPSKVARMTYKLYDFREEVNVDKNHCLFTFDQEGRVLESAKPILGFNPKFDKTEHNAVVYDLNSAYAAVLCDKIIDTKRRKLYSNVKVGEVGFRLNSDLDLVEAGSFADVVFPLIDSPYKEFAEKWYKIKKTAPKNSKERVEAKSILVIMVGLWQLHNPFMRAYVVNTCNKRIEYYLNKYPDKITMWNTDAIYATEHIKELDDLVGDDIGQFKVEYEGLLRQSGFNYQKVEINQVVYRGVLNQAFKFDQNFNLLTDNLPKAILPFTKDPNCSRVIKNQEFYNEETEEIKK